MAVPKHSDLYRLILESLQDGKVHHWRDCIPYIVQKLKLTAEDCQVMLTSGRRPMLDDRVQWAVTYVRQAGLLEYPRRGYCKLSDEGRRVLNDTTLELNNAYLMRYDAFAKFVSGGRNQGTSAAEKTVTKVEEAVVTPVERMNEAFAELNRALETELLDEILSKKDFKFFERMVVDLVMAMGYGSDEENAGVVTQATSDGGIDGIISEDKLGFNKIYIQAKCWDRGNTVSRPEIQKFVGALAGMGANKGLFITTSQYSKEAVEYAKSQHIAKVVLVDGSRMAKLMIEHGVGVSPVSQYVVKRLDSDYFNPN